MIGGSLRSADPDRQTLDEPQRIVARETAQGLVTLDAAGQVRPGLAESWIVTDDGLSLIFRLRHARWPDGSDVTAPQVAASLARGVGAASHNSLKPLLMAVGGIVPMTGRIIEVRLRVPRPNMFQLLAQPELGIRREGLGAGPWRAVRQGGALVLTPLPDPDMDADTPPPLVTQVTLRSERVGKAIARFQAGRAALVSGGTLADWPVAQAAHERSLRIDPAEGLFGIGIRPTTPMLRDVTIREALAMAIDREAMGLITGVPRWTVAQRLLPAQLDSARVPVEPNWGTTSLDDRRRAARSRIAGWIAVHGEPAPLKIALPAGPGMRLVMARLTVDFRMIGLRVEAVAWNVPDADLVLIDEVSPNGSANWYLTRTGCEAGFACSDLSEQALQAARVAPSLVERARAIADADAAAAQASGYIPLSTPLRWSMVDESLNGWRENAFAVHPLGELRVPRN
ncbi:ABC transporter substrate-binding protein [Sphingomonas antarctica]|uniref:ABC transporter substrate-binding protein n=1 Tax=Sphingomonas antarctica TaxID=2040274 RepID=UPI0039ECF2E7